MGRAIQVVLWLTLATVLALVLKRHPPPMPVPVAANAAARAALGIDASPRSLPVLRPIVAPPIFRAAMTSLRPCRLRGIVLDTSGAPTPASLTLLRAVPHSRLLESYDDWVNVDKAEGFDIELPPGEYFVFARHEDRSSTLEGPFLLALGEELSEVALTLQPGNDVEGLVVAKDGTPSGGEVMVVVDAGEHTFVTMREPTIESRFSIGDLPHERLVVTAIDDEGNTASASLAGPERGLILRLSGTSPALHITVRDAHGAPVCPARVDVKTSTTSWTDMTDEEGTVVMHPNDERVRVEVNAELGYADPVIVELDRDKAIEIVLRAGGAVRGRLLNSDGTLASSLVTLTPIDLHPGESTATPTTEGRFAWTGLRPGKFTLSADCGAQRGQRSVPLAEVSLAEGETRDLGDLRLAADGVVRGVVRYEDGAPAAYAEIEQIDSNTNSEYDMNVRTDEEGRFELTVSSTMQVRALAHSGNPSAPWTVHPGDTAVALSVATISFLRGVVRELPEGGGSARCGLGLWSQLQDDGSVLLPCLPGSTMDVVAGGELRSFAVPVTPGETSYFDIAW